jgi:Arc/MetJ-type ribon-helix-helix transcriptional regulator
MARPKKTILTRSTGVSLEEPVIEFLDQLVRTGLAKDRSAVMNQVIRQYADTIGKHIPSARIEMHQTHLPNMR